MEKIYWIGPRESDISEVESIFAGSITIYGSNSRNNKSFCRSNTDRINHNMHNPDCDAFIQAELKKIVKKEKNARFLFYNPAIAYDFDYEIFSHSICLNNYELFMKLQDKVRCRIMLQQIVETIPFVTLSGKDCYYNNIRDYFDSDEFVIQDAFSSGGEGTIHLKESDTLYSIYNNKQYLVSPYINNGISINVHIVIGSEDICFFHHPFK